MYTYIYTYTSSAGDGTQCLVHARQHASPWVHLHSCTDVLNSPSTEWRDSPESYSFSVLHKARLVGRPLGTYLVLGKF
jgi:hypothetical protein